MLFGCNGNSSKKDGSTALRVALVLPGKITDKSWNQAGYEGLKLAEKELGIEVTYCEQVAQPDQAESMADYARRGYKVVMGHGGEFQEAAMQVARKHPGTLFVVNNGTTTADNVSIITFQYVQLGYVVGYLSAKVSTSGKVGFISGTKIKANEDMLEGFRKGVKAGNPKAEVLVAWTNDYDDVAKGKEAALNQISQGADILLPMMDNATLGCLQAAKEKNGRAIGMHYDAIKDWPGTVIQSAIPDMPGAILNALKQVKGGATAGKAFRFGFDTPDALHLGTYDASVPREVRDEVQGLIEKMKKGELNP